MRIVKQRLLEMIPELQVFLDVDDLESISDLESYISQSSAVLVFCSKGYFESRNCMRELRSAVEQNKPLIALLESWWNEPGRPRGGLSIREVAQKVLDSEASYGKWGFANKPEPAALSDALLNGSHDPIEWNRIGEFQDVRRSVETPVARARMPVPDRYILTCTLYAGEYAPDCRGGDSELARPCVPARGGLRHQDCQTATAPPRPLLSCVREPPKLWVSCADGRGA